MRVLQVNLLGFFYFTICICAAKYPLRYWPSFRHNQTDDCLFPSVYPGFMPNTWAKRYLYELPLDHWGSSQALQMQPQISADSNLFLSGQDRWSGEKSSVVRWYLYNISRNWVSFLELLENIKEVWKEIKGKVRDNFFGLLLYCSTWKLHILIIMHKKPVHLPLQAK